MARVARLLLAVVLFVAALVALAPLRLFLEPGTGIDASWHIAINLAVENGLVFGEEFRWPYGPLAVLVTRLPIGVGKLPLVLFDAFLLGSFAVVLSDVLRRFPGVFARLLIFLVVLRIALVPTYTTWVDNVLFSLFLYAICRCLARESVPLLGWACVTALLAFFIKVNVGFPAVFLLGLYLCGRLVSPGRLSRRTILCVGLGFSCALPLAAWLLNTDLAQYVESLAHLAGAFNEAMFTPVSAVPGALTHLYCSLAILGLFALACLRDVRSIWRDRGSLARHLLAGLFAFILFKHAYVRPVAHLAVFSQFVAVPLGLLAMFEQGAVRARRERLFVIAVGLAFLSETLPQCLILPELRQEQLPLVLGLYGAAALLGLAALLEPVRRRAWLRALFCLAVLLALTVPQGDLFYRFLGRKLAGIGAYVTALRSAAPADEGPPGLLPEMLELVGKSSVDVYPSEISLVHRHGLSYAPRPVPQSWSVYDDFLDRRNAEFLLTDRAPDFVLFALGDIDGRHPFFTESRTHLALLRRYEPVLETPGLLILRREDRIRGVTTVSSGARAGRLGEFIELEPSDDPLFLSVDIEYTVAGRLASLLFQPAPLQVTVELAGGERLTYRAVRTILRGAVLANRFAADTAEAAPFFRAHGRGGRRVRRLEFHTSQPWAFQEGFEYTTTIARVAD